MMRTLVECKFKTHYSVPKNDVEKALIIPALKCGIRYDRATGFFSSEALVSAIEGVDSLVKNGGHIRMLTSPRLDKDDMQAIKKGYDLKKIVEKRMIYGIDKDNKLMENRLCLLSHLIATGILEMKVCLMRNNIGMYHPKSGIIEDQEHNKIFFDGSMNETENGYSYNWESVSLIKSWNTDDFDDLQKEFDDVWDGRDPTVITLETPDVITKMIAKYKVGAIEDYLKVEDLDKCQSKPSKYFKKPKNIELHEYQKEAITNWETNNFRGIYHMATGTGKTITALSSLERLCNKLRSGCITVIVCPLIYLVEQWADKVSQYGVSPIVCHSYSGSDWAKEIASITEVVNKGGKNENGFNSCGCIVTTINTFKSSKMRQLIDNMNCKKILVVDEVHHMGSRKSLTYLDERFEYRLGLTATLERHNDSEGTEKLLQYFEKICKEYTLDEAIDNGFLTPYYYHPIVCEMNNDEYNQILQINKEIQEIKLSNKSEKQIEKMIENYKLTGARIIASLDSKIENLVTLITTKYYDDHYMLIYCGGVSIDNERSDAKDLEFKEKLIDRITKTMGIKNNIKLAKFTCTENLKQRKQIANNFKTKAIQAIVAIRCLDEGIDIPEIKTAFITSSGKDPREYVQRRGRVLRTAKDKEFATIYDFITIPNVLSNNLQYSSTKNVDLYILKNEIDRMRDFGKLCMNPTESSELIDRIKESYGLIEEGESFE